MKERIITIGDLFNPGDKKASALFAEQTPEKQQKLLRDLHAIAPHLVGVQTDGTFAPKDDEINLYTGDFGLRVLDNGEPKIFTITHYANIDDDGSVTEGKKTTKDLEIKIQKIGSEYFLVGDDGSKSKIEFKSKPGTGESAFIQTKPFNSGLDELREFPTDLDGYTALDRAFQSSTPREIGFKLIATMTPKQLSIKHARNFTALHYAAREGYPDIATLLGKMNEEQIGAQDTYGATALHHATYVALGTTPELRISLRTAALELMKKMTPPQIATKSRMYGTEDKTALDFDKTGELVGPSLVNAIKTLIQIGGIDRRELGISRKGCSWLSRITGHYNEPEELNPAQAISVLRAHKRDNDVTLSERDAQIYDAITQIYAHALKTMPELRDSKGHGPVRSIG